MNMFMQKKTAVVETLGSLVLAAKAAPVTKVTPEIREFAKRMEAITFSLDGIGLAAPQAGKSLRMVSLCLTDPHRDRPDSPGELLLIPRLPATFINPEITEYSKETCTAEEGCLSVPGLYAPVTRPERVIFRGTTLEGELLEYECAGLLARLVQHELDHLDGICFTDRLTESAARQYKKAINSILRSGKRSNYKKIVII